MNLETLQRQMAASIMQPLTADEQMQSHSADGRSMQAVAESFIAPNTRLTAFERLEIYNRQYWFRVIGALAEDFRALAAIVGAAAFDRLSVAYLAAHPSRSFTLRNLGRQLPAWLAANPSFAGRRHRLAVDVALIEWAFVEAFDSAERAPLRLEQIATLGADSRLSLQPHLQLMALDYPTDDLVLSLHKRDKRQSSEAGIAREDSQPPPLKLSRLRRRPTWVAAHRVDLSVYYRRLEREEFLTLTALQAGQPLAEAIANGFSSSRMPQSRQSSRIQDWFATWAELGWICATDLEFLHSTER